MVATDQIETYQGPERDQVFVKSAAWMRGDDDRWLRYVSPEWAFCVQRHRDRWGDKRTIPKSYQWEGEHGWFFPVAWLLDFSDSPQADMPAKAPRVTASGPVADLAGGGGDFPKVDEFRRWQLPAGAVIVAANATVIYPGGAVVTWGELRRGRADEARAA